MAYPGFDLLWLEVILILQCMNFNLNTLLNFCCKTKTIRLKTIYYYTQRVM